MVRLAASLVGTYFAAFAATSLVVAGGDAPAAGSEAAGKASVAQSASRGDRLPVAEGALRKGTVAEVELIGGDDLVVILRDGEGREVYRVERASNLTSVARDVSLPQLRLHAETSEEAERDAIERSPGSLPDTVPRFLPHHLPRTVPTRHDDRERGEEELFACESGLSTLVGRRAASVPRLCLAQASDGSPIKLR